MYIVEYLRHEQLTEEVKEIVDSGNKNAVILHKVDYDKPNNVKFVLRSIVKRQDFKNEEELRTSISCLDETDIIDYFFQNNDLSNLFEGKE